MWTWFISPELVFNEGRVLLGGAFPQICRIYLTRPSGDEPVESV